MSEPIQSDKVDAWKLYGEIYQEFFPRHGMMQLSPAALEEFADRLLAEHARRTLARSAAPLAEPVRDPVLRFAVLMERELKENDHKGGWEQCQMGYLLRRIREELEELISAVVGGKDPAVIASEAADVANFAMMIADVRQALPKGAIWRTPSHAARSERTAKQQFDEHMGVDDATPLERLRFFCSLAMNGQDWLDVEPFFDAIAPSATAFDGDAADAKRFRAFPELMQAIIWKKRDLPPVGDLKNGFSLDDLRVWADDALSAKEGT